MNCHFTPFSNRDYRRQLRPPSGSGFPYKRMIVAYLRGRTIAVNGYKTELYYGVHTSAKSGEISTGVRNLEGFHPNVLEVPINRASRSWTAVLRATRGHPEAA